jgi:NADH dehydrogenase
VVNYLAADEMIAAMAGATQVVHLVGIIKESASSRYADAHEGATAVVMRAAAAAGATRILYLSILGSSPASANACLASKGRAEQALLAGPVPALVLRVPMVLGEGDYASAALAARARKRLNVLLRGASLEQPIYAGDVIAAVAAGLHRPGLDGVALDLAGPTSLSRAELTRRAAAVLGRSTRVLSLPLAVGLALAWVLERVSGNPPVTRAMLGVLDHDDDIDAAPAAAQLGIGLTPLDDMLRRVVGEALPEADAPSDPGVR